MYRRALARGEVAINPTIGIELPAIRSGRDRIVSPDEAAQLLDALPECDRGLWATAMYAGLRRGELQALRWEDIELDRGVIHVRHGWDAKEGEIGPKSQKGERTVPIPAILRGHLEHQWLAGGTVATCSAMVIGRLPRGRSAIAPRGRGPGWTGSPCTSVDTLTPASPSPLA
jgi:integrase